LLMLATEANALLMRELEMEMREGMERGRPSSNHAEPSYRNTTTNEKVEKNLPTSPAHAYATLPPIGDDTYFSPLSTHGDLEDIVVRRGLANAISLEPYNICDNGLLIEEEDFNNTCVVGVSASPEADDRRPSSIHPSGPSL